MKGYVGYMSKRRHPIATITPERKTFEYPLMGVVQG